MQYALAAGAGLAGLRALSQSGGRLRLRGGASHGLRPQLAIMHGDARPGELEPRIVRLMTRAAVNALGGIRKLVKKGDRVVIKPNMAWNRPPEMAANTNPWVVAALVEMCRGAGARWVKVMDHTISKDPRSCYQTSGIAQAAAQAGAQVAYVDRSRFVEVPIEDGYALTRWLFYDEFVSADLCDVLINVPVLKHHGTSRLSIGLKNVLGMAGGERGDLHKQIHRKIADLNRVVRADLTVMDAYRVMRLHGPTGGRLDDVDNSVEGARRIVAGVDPVAVDAYGAWMFGYKQGEIGFVDFAAQAGLGSADWRAAGVVEESVPGVHKSRPDGCPCAR